MIIRYGQQEITQADIDAVVTVLKSINLTQGPNITEFEQSVLEHTGGGYAVAVNSATSALHIACLALDLGPGDTLWTTPNTFVASSNCALYCGAQVDFVDIDPRTYNICAVKLEEKLRIARQLGKLPKIVVPVHLTGQPCDMEAIYGLSLEYGFRIIEDASHAIGAKYRNEHIGSCRYSDITVFSFHPVKIITTAEGGMAVTNQKRLADRMGLFRSHGITRDPALMTQEMDGSWYYQQVELGYNYRITDIQAALGISQMRRLAQYIERRRALAARYDSLLADLPLQLPWQHPDSLSAYHLYVIRLKLDKISLTHAQVFENLREKNIMVNLHYIPVHTQPYYQKMGFQTGDFPAAEQYYAEAISIPLHPSLSDSEQDIVIAALRDAIGL